MKTKKLLTISICILLISGITFFIMTHIERDNIENPTDITPEEEISDEQMKQTMVTLFFIDSEKDTLKTEGRLITTNNLLADPYKELINLLLSGPKTSGLESAIPKDVKIISTNLEKQCVTLDFSPEILNFEDDDQKCNIINSLLNTLAQLNEVNSIKITVNGEPNENFTDEYSIIN